MGNKNRNNTTPKNAPVPAVVSKGTRIRLGNDKGQTLMFTKKVGKNGAIRVSATISQKGHKPQKVGRETFANHTDANGAMDRMTAQAAEKGWTLKTRSTAYAPSVDKAIEIPGADEVVASEVKAPKAEVETPEPVEA